MQNKNKKNNLIYFRKFNSNDFKYVKSEQLNEKEKKEGKKAEILDKSKLTTATNNTLIKFQNKLQELPIDLRKAIRTHISQHFFDSYSQFDDNSKKGLNQKEYTSYKASIVSKLDETLNKYTPSQEAIDAKHSSEKKSEKMSQQEIKKMEELSKESFDSSKLNNPDGIQSEWQKVVAKSQAVSKEYEKSMKKTQIFFREYQDFEKSKNDWDAPVKTIRNGLSWVAGKVGLSSASNKLEDPARKRMKKLKREHTKRIDTEKKSIQKQNKVIDDYSQDINSANDDVRQTIMDQKVSSEDQLTLLKQAQIDKTEEKKLTTEKYKEFKEYRNKLANNLATLREAKDGFLSDQTELEEQQGVRQEDMNVKEDKLAQSSLGITQGIKMINQALKNKKLPEDKKKILKAKKQELIKSLKGIDDGFNSIDEGKLESEEYLTEKTIEIESKLESNDNSQIDYSTAIYSTDNSIDALTTSIETLDNFILENSTKSEQLDLQILKINEGLENFDKMDKQIADHTLDINITGSKMNSDLETAHTNITSTKISGPNIWESTVGLLFNKIGTGLKLIGDPLFSEFSNLIDRLNIPVISDISAFCFDFTSGAISALGDMVIGFEMLLEHPIDTISAIGQLMPWAENAGENWSNMFSAILGGEHFEKGEIVKGIGASVFNIASCFIGVGAVGKAGTAAKLSVQLAGKTGFVGAMIYAKTFAVAFPGQLAKGIGQTLKGIVQFPGKAATAGVAFVKQMKTNPTILEKAGAQIQSQAGQVASISEQVADVASDMASKIHEKFKDVKNLDDAKHTKDMSPNELIEFQKYKDKNKRLEVKDRKAHGLNDDLANKSLEELKALKADDLKKLGLTSTKDHLQFVEYITQRQSLLTAELKLNRLKTKETAILIDPQLGKLFTSGGHPKFRGPKGEKKLKEFISKYNESSDYVSKTRAFGLYGDNMVGKVIQSTESGLLAFNTEGKLQIFKSAEKIEEFLLAYKSERLKRLGGNQYNPNTVSLNRVVPDKPVSPKKSTTSNPRKPPRTVELPSSKPVGTVDFIPAKTVEAPKLKGELHYLVSEINRGIKISNSNVDLFFGSKDGISVLKRYIKEGKLQTNPVFDSMLDIGEVNTKILQKELQLLKTGEIPLSRSLLDDLLNTEEGARQLNKLLKKDGPPFIKFGDYVSPQFASERLALSLSKFEDLQALRIIRNMDNSSEFIKTSIQSALKGDVSSGNPFVDIIDNLKKRDPEAHAILSDVKNFDMIIASETLDALISGRKIIKKDTLSGNTYSYYLGKAPGKGGMGLPEYTIYRNANGELVHAVIKRPKLSTSSSVWTQEVKGTLQASKFSEGNPNVIKALGAGDDFLVLETGMEAFTLVKALTKISFDEYLLLFHDQLTAQSLFFKNNVYHGDIKGGNIFTWKDKSGNRIAKIADNSPMPFDESLELIAEMSPEKFDFLESIGKVGTTEDGYNFLKSSDAFGEKIYIKQSVNASDDISYFIRGPHTPGRIFDGNDLVRAVKELEKKGLKTDEVHAHIARAQDIKSHGTMFGRAIARYVDTNDIRKLPPKVREAYNEIVTIQRKSQDIMTAGEAGFIDEFIEATNNLNDLLPELTIVSHDSKYAITNRRNVAVGPKHAIVLEPIVPKKLLPRQTQKAKKQVKPDDVVFLPSRDLDIIPTNTHHL